MRLTILAGLITGASLGMQVTLSAHIKPKVIPANSAIRIRVIAPWYMADATEHVAGHGILTKEAAEGSSEMRSVRSS
jgi:hypothetical protein